MATDDEFSRLVREHANYERQLEALKGRPFLTEDEQLQEINLKKRKLSLKDQMEGMIQRYKKESVHS
jgi:uncharacterized protein YdcH (DUF465 family)